MEMKEYSHEPGHRDQRKEMLLMNKRDGEVTKHSSIKVIETWVK